MTSAKGVEAVATIQVTLEFPEDLARDARELGILNEETIVELLQHEVERRVMDLVNTEIHAYRTEKSKGQSKKQTDES